MKKIVLVIFFFFICLLSPKIALANQSISCDNRFVTLVNPVRGRSLWSDKSLKPIQDQYAESSKYNMPVTWLLQFDALADPGIVTLINNFQIKGEVGLFLEVSRDLAELAGVVYPSGIKWASPQIVFLSAYSQSERRVLIDAQYKKFKSEFGYFPKSVGAWWIDSYSLNYIKEKYGLSAILIVADQKVTDSYGVWGGWWGYPYYPSKNNVIVPGNKTFLDSVVIEWAQRDPVLAYGASASFSNFSLQANDYVRNGKDTKYFESLVNTYLSCNNKLGQITIGMETGMEASDFHGEYKNQLTILANTPGLNFVTMNSFAKTYKDVYTQNPARITIGDWIMTPEYRENKILNDKVGYNPDISFKDYFAKDTEPFLKRDLSVSKEPQNSPGIKCFSVFIVVLGVFFFWINKINIWISSTLFLFAAFGLILRSGPSRGWNVFYGPFIQNLNIIQIVLSVFTTYIVFWLYVKIRRSLKDFNLFLWLIPLSFGIDGALSMLRYSNIDGGRFVGILIGSTRMVGLNIGEHFVTFVNKVLPPLTINAFGRIKFEEIYSKPVWYLIYYPLVHLLVSFIFYLYLIKLNIKIRRLVMILLIMLFVSHLVQVSLSDPTMVLPL